MKECRGDARSTRWSSSRPEADNKRTSRRIVSSGLSSPFIITPISASPR